MKVDFEYFTNLQYKVKSLTAKVRAFESGEAYVTLRQTFEKLLCAKDREIRALKEALAKAHSQAVTVRKHWFEVIDDMEKEYKKELAKRVREVKTIKEQLFQALRQRDEEKEKRLQKTRELYAALTELEEEREKNRKLTAQVNKDFENSSIPSSMKIGRKKIHNSRKKRTESRAASQDIRDTVGKGCSQPGAWRFRHRKNMLPVLTSALPERRSVKKKSSCM